MLRLGLTSFVETTYDPIEDKLISHAERIRNNIDEIVFADELGLDSFGVGEHHREDYAATNPEIILGAAAARTKNIRLMSAVTVLSSADPVRVYENFATVDAISNGRVEIMAGRGSFIESFPLFGYSLEDYDELYEEKLDLLLQLVKGEPVTWSGKFRAPLTNQRVYPDSVQKPIPVTIASGGSPESAMRAGQLGLPLVLAIIGGTFDQFSYAVQAYWHAAREAGHDLSKLYVSVHSHGYVGATNEQAAEDFYPSMEISMNKVGKERGWRPYTRETFNRAIEKGALFVGDAEFVANKILYLKEQLGIGEFLLHSPMGSIPHEYMMRSLERYGKDVAPIVRAATKNDKPQQ